MFPCTAWAVASCSSDRQAGELLKKNPKTSPWWNWKLCNAEHFWYHCLTSFYECAMIESILPHCINPNRHHMSRYCIFAPSVSTACTSISANTRGRLEIRRSISSAGTFLLSTSTLLRASSGVCYSAEHNLVGMEGQGMTNRWWDTAKAVVSGLSFPVGNELVGQPGSSLTCPL